ncbi:MAG TPA: winged helix-turn-helix domain-containing protein [Allosphingosinicella sp.]|jgi:DNA-binding winged helix-turn-helix (wHTH) protein/Tfp pilus assembly protein PilF
MHGSGVDNGTAQPLVRRPDVVLGPIVISPATRTVSGYGGRAVLEPRMMQVLLCLAERPGGLVTRAELLDRCWGAAAVGDDSLNRAIAGIRRAARQAVGEALQIETVAGAGYALALQADQADGTTAGKAPGQEAVAEGWRSWRLGLPVPDRSAIQRLRRAVEAEPRHAEGWAVLALLLRHAAEHAQASDCARYVEECRGAADAALALDPCQGTARAALVSLPPLFGDWLSRRARLTAILEEQADSAPAMHDLAILEMATGRPSAAIPLIEALMERDALAAIFHYKRVYHLWTLGRLSDMDQAADRAMQMWPRHPAIWFARFWSLAFTGRPDQAMQQLADDGSRPDIPLPALVPLEKTLIALRDGANQQARVEAVNANIQAAARGPAQSVAAIIHLGGLGAVEEALDVAETYLTRRGPVAVSLRRTDTDPSITDQHRRVTQMLFIPASAPLRRSPRFDRLCEEIGLSDYWRRAGVVPDHR